MSQKFEITFVISVSIDAETAPDYIKEISVRREKQRCLYELNV